MSRRKGIWPKKKRILINRDGRNCHLCGKPLTWREMTFDHIIPRSRGGSHHTDNLKLACAKCNSDRGNAWLGPLAKPLSYFYDPREL